MTEEVRRQWSGFVAAFEKVMASPPPVAERAYFDTLAPAVLALESSTYEIISVNQDAMVGKSDRSRHRSERMESVMMGVTVAALLLGILVSGYLTSRLTRPLSVLTQAVRRLAEGDLAARAKLDGEDEIAQVAGEFNTMAARLGEYRSSSLGELLQAQQSSQAAIDSLPDPVFILASSGTLLNVNRAAENLFGVSVEVSGQDPFVHADPAVREMVGRARNHVTGGRAPSRPRVSRRRCR